MRCVRRFRICEDERLLRSFATHFYTTKWKCSSIAMQSVICHSVLVSISPPPNHLCLYRKKNIRIILHANWFFAFESSGDDKRPFLTRCFVQPNFVSEYCAMKLSLDDILFNQAFLCFFPLLSSTDNVCNGTLHGMRKVGLAKCESGNNESIHVKQSISQL